LQDGFTRLESLKKGETPWLTQTGLVPRGYLSKIDGSVQTYGLVVPPSFKATLPKQWPLDCWFHGRGETLTELDFIHGRQTSAGEFTPADTLVLHPYGRYGNGQRFAGETDFFEALEAVKRDYKIDENRIIVRGFSLGGAACWHIATHHPASWCAANPGAGFSETEQFLNFFQGEKLKPYPWERKLWNLYDSTTVSANLLTCPTVAYSGEIDKQKQAADLMALAFKREGMELTHIIGAKTAHSYEKAAKEEVAKRIDALREAGRDNTFPEHVRLVTYTLAHNRQKAVRIWGMEHHWEEARVEMDVIKEPRTVEVRTKNVTVLGFEPMEKSPLFSSQLKIDGQAVPQEDNAWPYYEKIDGKWQIASGLEVRRRPGKRPGLQGPIDDAFMSSFIFVRPTGKAANEKAGAWAKSEMERAIEHWRRHFRGDARVKDDTAVTEEDIKSANLVLWGDPSSNSLMAKVAGKIPVSWTGTEIKAGAKSFPAADHALICIYPNPLNPERYVVLNSSFTYRDYDYLNNARETPKLPDWAIIDLNTPPNSRYPGGIPLADFFGEKWELKAGN
jgi:pimeloyl-ACP methyl ester carboxylesterase